MVELKSSTSDLIDSLHSLLPGDIVMILAEMSKGKEKVLGTKLFCNFIDSRGWWVLYKTTLLCPPIYAIKSCIIYIYMSIIIYIMVVTLQDF